MTDAAEKLDNIINGIDTNKVIELATRISQEADFGKFVFRAENQWIDGSRSRTSIKNFYAGGGERTERINALTVDADQPTFLAGQNTAPNAVEHYLNALTSCLNTTLVYHSSVQGIPLEKLDISAEGQMNARGFFGISDDVNRGYEKVTVEMKVKSPAEEETLRKLAMYSPVYEMVSKAIPVELNIQVE